MADVREIRSERIVTRNGALICQRQYVSTYPNGYEPIVEYVEGCAYCERMKESQSTFFPSHFAGGGCRSGHRNHCTCDGCF